MDIEEKKETLKSALIDSFVNDNQSYKNTIKSINDDLKKFNIDYQYTYDEFCVDFLNESLLNIEKNDIFEHDINKDFYSNFWLFNLMTLQSMLSKKIYNLGKNISDIYNENKEI